MVIEAIVFRDVIRHDSSRLKSPGNGGVSGQERECTLRVPCRGLMSVSGGLRVSGKWHDAFAPWWFLPSGLPVISFWKTPRQRHLRKFNGVPKEHFPLFLKECEWRFNNPDPQTQLKQLNQWVQQLLT
jgi:transposase-like protein